MTSPSQNFWNFSIALYSRGRVADACLDLQNSYGIDVNLLLFCYWHGLYHGEFPDATLAHSLQISSIWKQEVVQPLRNVRQWMKKQNHEFARLDQSQYETLRARIKFDELAAEKYQQEMLEQLALSHTEQGKQPFGTEACNRNIEKLFAAINVEINDLIAVKLKIVAKAVQAMP